MNTLYKLTTNNNVRINTNPNYGSKSRKCINEKREKAFKHDEILLVYFLFLDFGQDKLQKNNFKYI